MIDNTKKFSTLIKIEYNFSGSNTPFHICEALQELFHKMAIVDPAIKIYTMEKNQLLWDMDCLFVNMEFVQEHCRLREQVFCKGSKKVTLFCIVESKHTMNQLKYIEIVREYIFHHNIWIKPDFYSSQVVSFPGFLTLVHPKITNKVELTRELLAALTSTWINDSESVVKEWYQRRECACNIMIEK